MALASVLLLCCIVVGATSDCFVVKVHAARVCHCVVVVVVGGESEFVLASSVCGKSNDRFLFLLGLFW